MVARLAEVQYKRFREQLANMPVEYLACHNFGHLAAPATVNPVAGVFVVGLVCSSCDMEIDRFRDSYTGRVISRYWHPRGDYYFTGTGRITPEMKLEIEQAWRDEAKLPANAEIVEAFETRFARAKVAAHA